MTRVENWFREINERWWPGQEFGLQISEVLYHQKSKYQDVLLFKSRSYGNVLVLDNCIQCTERDEFAYHEMAAFLPLMAHPCPRKILIIGGGDGGVLRQLLKHPHVEEVILCEIDQDVVEVSKKYLPGMREAMENAKVTICIANGIEFLREYHDEFDVIITDSSDPEGPAEDLFQKPFYELMKTALRKPHGMICCQGECIWLDLPLIKEVLKFSRELFPSVAYAYLSMPTYTCGTIGFFLCSIDPNARLAEPKDVILADQLGTRYYSPEVHRAAFVLPKFANV